MSIGNKNKSDLNLFCQKSRIPIAVYTSVFEDGNFVSTVTVKGSDYRSTCGYSTKKEAENDAAGVALIAILQTEFGGKTIEDVLMLLEQRFPSKNKKKPKQVANYSEPASQKHALQMDLSSNATASQLGPAQTQHTSMSEGRQPQLMSAVPTSMHQETEVASRDQITISQAHTPPQMMVGVQQTNTSGSTVPQSQMYHQQCVVGSQHSDGTHQSQMVVSQPPLVYPSSSYPQSLHQPLQQPLFSNQGQPMYPRGVSPEYVQKTASPGIATSANFCAQHHATGRLPLPTHSQPGPHPLYAPSTGAHPQVVQGPIQPNASTHSYYAAARPGMPINYQGLPPPGFLPPPVHGMYPSRPPTSTATGVRATPTHGMQRGNIAARFPGATPPTSSGLNPQQTVSSMQTSPGKPLNAIPISVDRQGLPAGVTSQDSRKHDANPTTGLENGHTKALADYCQKRNLPQPNYKVTDHGKQKYSAEVRVGCQTYRTHWICDDFEQAKTVAAMEALANVAVSLSISDSGNPQKPESRGNPSRSNSQAQTSSQSTSTSYSTTPTGGQSTTVRGQSTNSTQNPASKLSESTSNTQPVPAPSSTQTLSLQPPSFFTKSPSPSAAVQPEQKQHTVMAVNYKQVLNIHCQRNHIPVTYECSSSEDSVGYIATVKTSGCVFESSPHGTKRAAEAAAAEKAVKALGLMGPSGLDHHHQQRGSSPVHVLHGGGGHPTTSASASHAQSAGMVSYKNLLQEHAQKQGLSLPHYETERVEMGFQSTVRVHRSGSESVEFTSGPQPVKKAAEQEAAKLACVELSLI